MPLIRALLRKLYEMGGASWCEDLKCSISIAVCRYCIPSTVADPFFAATGHYIEQITSDAEDNASLLTVYPCIQSTCPNLEVLVINHPCSAFGVFKILEACQDSIRELSLRGSNSGRDNMPIDRVFCPNMHSMCFQGSGFAAQFISTVLQGCPNLEVIRCAQLQNLPQTGTVPEGLHFIARMIYPLLTLRVLDVSETFITDAGLKRLAELCPSLESFTATKCSALTDASITSLTTHCKNIQELRISRNSHFSDQSLAAIASTYAAKLTSLDVAACRRMTGAGVASAVEQCRFAQELESKGTAIFARGADELCSVLRCA